MSWFDQLAAGAAVLVFGCIGIYFLVVICIILLAGLIGVLMHVAVFMEAVGIGIKRWLMGGRFLVRRRRR